MTNQQLEIFLFQYTESEQRHLREQPPQLSPRYRNIPKVVYNGREMYQFNFGSLLKIVRFVSIRNPVLPSFQSISTR